MKFYKYIIVVASLFGVIHLMELVLFPSDYKSEIKTIKKEVKFLEEVAQKAEFISLSFL